MILMYLITPRVGRYSQYIVGKDREQIKIPGLGF